MYVTGVKLSRNARLGSQMVPCLPAGSLDKPHHPSWLLCPHQGRGSNRKMALCWTPKGLRELDHSHKIPSMCLALSRGLITGWDMCSLFNLIFFILW